MFVSSAGEVKTLMIQLLRGVRHLHDNWILHRDLKTSNLLLSHKGILKVNFHPLHLLQMSPMIQKCAYILVSICFLLLLVIQKVLQCAVKSNYVKVVNISKMKDIFCFLNRKDHFSQCVMINDSVNVTH